MIRVWFDWPYEPERESVARWCEAVPRVGEKVGIVESGDGGHRRLDPVMEVQHYPTDASLEVPAEIRVLVGEPPF